MGVRKNFSMRGNVEILLILFRLLTMQCKRPFTKRLLHFTASHKKCTSLAAIAKYIAISLSYKTDYLQIFQAGVESILHLPHAHI